MIHYSNFGVIASCHVEILFNLVYAKNVIVISYGLRIQQNGTKC